MPASAITALGPLIRRTWKSVLRRPVVLTFSLIQPLMWMLFFGFLFHRYALDEVPGANSYLQFLMPGVCAMAVLFGASQSGTAFIRDMQSGFLGRMLRTSTSPSVLLAGKLAADVARLCIQAAAVALLGMALGARYEVQGPAFGFALVHLVLFAAAYSSLSCWIALATRSQEAMGAFIQAFNMPILFTSTALVPIRQMPDVLETLARWNPLSAVVESLRGALIPGSGQGRVTLLLLLGASAALLFAGAARSLSRYRCR